ncbi:hypothetical protein ERJ75_000302800 [Trypanosoma vivax]|nr:hypothetical protein ERJ75_001207600 [Trypanosoma vivax]KAH8618182.1 hypothetical protein ERJ75_000302800 [Trypanosoma vivax]
MLSCWTSPFCARSIAPRQQGQQAQLRVCMGARDPCKLLSVAGSRDFDQEATVLHTEFGGALEALLGMSAEEGGVSFSCYKAVIAEKPDSFEGNASLALGEARDQKVTVNEAAPVSLRRGELAESAEVHARHF